jgi:DNA topoisomerase-1
MYRLGKKGRFLSCTRYPECDYASPIDATGKPQPPLMTDILCPICGSGMTKRAGRFGAFMGCVNYPTCKGIVRIDPKKNTVMLPKVAALAVDVKCEKCGRPLNLRRGARGPWLSCSGFPKCRGRMAWSALEPDKQAELEALLEQHEKANPVPVLKNTSGQIVGEGYVPVTTGSGPELSDDAVVDET